jgi:hypothetical protein
VARVRIWVSGLAWVLAALVAGCAKKPPDCADPKTVGLVKQIYLDAVRKAASDSAPGASFIDEIVNSIPMQLSLIRVQAVDEKVGRYSCDADLEVTLPERASTLTNSQGYRDWSERNLAGTVEVVDRKLKTHIKYNSQLTADNNQHVVEVEGLRGIARAMVALGKEGVLDRPKPVAKEPAGDDKLTATASPDPPPAPAPAPAPAEQVPAAPVEQKPVASPPAVPPAPAPTIASTSEAVMAMVAASRVGNNADILSAKIKLDSFPRPDRGDRKIAREKNTQGLALLKANTFGAAIERFSEGAKFDPSDVELVNNLGYAMVMAGRLPEARKTLVDAIALDSSRAAAWANLAQAFAKGGEEESAVATFLITFTFSKSQLKTVEFLKGLADGDPDPKVKAAAAKALDAPLIRNVTGQSK